MDKIFVNADTYTIQIETNCKKMEEYIDNHIEDFRRLTIQFERCYEDRQCIDMTFQYNDSDEYELEMLHNNVLCLKCPWEAISHSTVIPMAFRLIVEILRQNRKEIKMHASAVAKGDTAILFIAPSEGGKTSTAMRMCQEYGCELIANDATVVSYIDGVPMILRGDSLFKVRANGMQAYLAGNKNDVEMAVETDTPWYEKKIIETEELGITKATRRLELKYVFFVKLDALVKGCSCLRYNAEEENERWFKQRMMVLQNLSGTIRGVDLIPTGNDGSVLPLCVPCLDNTDLNLNRIQFLNSLFEDCEIYQTRGQLDAVAQFINDVAFGGS